MRQIELIFTLSVSPVLLFQWVFLQEILTIYHFRHLIFKYFLGSIGAGVMHVPFYYISKRMMLLDIVKYCKKYHSTTNVYLVEKHMHIFKTI